MFEKYIRNAIDQYSVSFNLQNVKYFALNDEIPGTEDGHVM